MLESGTVSRLTCPDQASAAAGVTTIVRGNTSNGTVNDDSLMGT
jgi:hypothetical protein